MSCCCKEKKKIRDVASKGVKRGEIRWVLELLGVCRLSHPGHVLVDFAFEFLGV